MQLEALITELLTKYSRAYVPGWGSFYLVQREARFDSVTETAFPSGKFVAFNAKSTGNGTALAAAAARHLGGNLEGAQAWVRRKVNAWQKTLEQGNVLMLPGLGSFRPGVHFQPEKTQLFDERNFGFTPIMLHPVQQASALEAKMTASLKRVTETRRAHLSAWQRAGVAAAIALLVSLGVYQSDLPTQAAGWWGGSSVESAEEPHAVETPTPAETPETISTAVAEEAVVEAPTETTFNTPVAKKAGYYIVVGSFKMDENAEKLATELSARGIDVRIIPGHLKKVAMGGYATRAEAVQALPAIKSSINAHAWIFAAR